MSTDRLMDLEVKLAFQEHQLSQLDDVLRETIVKMEQLARRVDEVEAEARNGLGPLENPKPPHY